MPRRSDRLPRRALRIGAGLFVLALTAAIAAAYYSARLFDPEPRGSMNDPGPSIRIGPLPRTSILVFLLCWAAAFLVGRCQHQEAAWAPTAVGRVDTLPAQAFVRREAYLRRQLGDSARLLERLRRRVAGIEVLQPERVVVYDTVLLPPDTVFLTVAMDARGALQADAGVRADTSGRVRPATLHQDVSLCDDGWLLAGDGRVVCNRPRFGRLDAFGAVGIRAEVDRPLKPPGEWESAAAAGLRWQPCLRCGTAVELQVDLEGRASVLLERRLKVW